MLGMFAASFQLLTNLNHLIISKDKEWAYTHTKNVKAEISLFISFVLNTMHTIV